MTERLSSVSAVAVLGAPASPAHLHHLLGDGVPADDGHLEVQVGGRALHVSKDLADDLAEQPQRERIVGLRRPLLVLHSPVDEVVGVDQAREIFEAARHPKSFVSLDGADHLLSRRPDAAFAAAMIATWAERYLEPDDRGDGDPRGAATAPRAAATSGAEAGDVLVEELSATDGFAHRVSASGHTWVLDEPTSVGGGDTGPNPYDSLVAALGGCTSMTMRMYARRKGWDLGTTQVTLRHERVHAKDCEECESSSGQVDRIHREIVLDEAPLRRAALRPAEDRRQVPRPPHADRRGRDHHGQRGCY